ncbi:MAG: peptidoglycan-binding protein [Alphaproteobacteria bacterium]
MTRYLFALLLALALAGPAAADDWAEATAAYEAGDYETAFKLMQPHAERGEPSAQHNLGLMYYTGQGVAQDDAMAAHWYRRAAEQDYAVAQYNLGLLYAKGQGVPQDYAEAYRWLDRAAANYPPGDERERAVKNRDLAASLLTPDQFAALGGADEPADKAGIAVVQEALARLGYDPGPADGLTGKRTRAAVEQYQRDNGLPVTGKITRGLAARLKDASL